MKTHSQASPAGEAGRQWQTRTRHEAQTIIAGRNPVLEALKAGTSIKKIVVRDGVHGSVIDEIRARALRSRIEITRSPQREFQQIAGETAAQGVLAIVSSRPEIGLADLIRMAEQRSQKGFLLILDGIEDPHNLGALIRTAECAGAHGVALPKHHAATVTPSAVKASAGATEHIAIAEVTNTVVAIEELKKQGYWIIGLDPSGNKEYTSVDYSTPVGIVVGSEGKGIRRLVKEHCDHLVRIPLHGRIASLNASVAGAIVMYEVVRQRQHLQVSAVQP